MATADARKLFVAGLPESITEDVVRQLFEATGGKVVEVSLPKDRATGKARGFGFVTFSVPEEANRARDALDGSMQAGRAISVRPFSSEPPKRGERSESRPEMPAAAALTEDRTLYVGNLPYDTSQQELSQLFEDNEVGDVARIHLPVGPDGRLRGFGFVTLATSDAANHAITALRNADLRGRRLMINIAHPKGERPTLAGASERPWPRSDVARPGEPRFSVDPKVASEGVRPPIERRRPPGATEGTDFSDDAKRKKKKGVKGASRERGTEARRRGGGTNWQALDDREEDDK